MNSTAVGFDFDHTLGIDHGLERRAFSLLADKLGAPIELTDPTTAALIDRLLAPFRRAETSMEQMIAQFAMALPALHVEPDDAAGLADDYRDLCYGLVDQLVEPLDGARKTIEALAAAGIAVGILTNGWSPLQEKKIARALGPFPGPVLVSDAIGAYKPSAEAFRQLGGALRCSIADLWFVGDDPSTDIAGAQAFGVRTIWLDNEGRTYPSNLAPPNAHIRHLDDVPKIVRGA